MALMNKKTFTIIYGFEIARRDINVEEYFEIDDMIAEVIQELNIKGYTTKYCCSGHNDILFTDTEIVFAEKCLPSILPKGFILENEEYYKKEYPKSTRPEGQICIRKWYKYEGDKLLDIINTMKDLVIWVSSLPFISEV